VYPHVDNLVYLRSGNVPLVPNSSENTLVYRLVHTRTHREREKGRGREGGREGERENGRAARAIASIAEALIGIK